MRETVWEYVAGSDTGTFYTAQQKWINKIYQLKKKFPDVVDIRHENEDGSLVVHLPSSWFKISPPKTMNLSDEQRQAARDRLAAARNNK